MFFALKQKLQSYQNACNIQRVSCYFKSSYLCLCHVFCLDKIPILLLLFSLISNSLAQISPPLGNISQITHKGWICSDVPITPWACFHSITYCVYWLSRESVYSALSSVTGTTSYWILFLFLDFLPWPYISLGLFYNDLGWYFLM